MSDKDQDGYVEVNVTDMMDTPTNYIDEIAETLQGMRAEADRARITAALRNFRITAEREAETGLIQIETNLALALDDVCQALGLSAEDTHEILGDKAHAYCYDLPIWQPEESAELELLETKLEKATDIITDLKNWAVWSTGGAQAETPTTT